MCHTDIHNNNNKHEKHGRRRRRRRRGKKKTKEISKTIGPWGKPNVLKNRHAP